MPSRPKLLTVLSEWLKTHVQTNQQVTVAYSGGRDSHVLLHALRLLCPQGIPQQLPSFFLKAIHIHHGLHADASHWQAHCQQICDQLNIPLTVRTLNLKPVKGESIEAIARQGRYQIFKEILQAGEWLLTAHSMDDQAETCLLQLCRGAGPLGLSGIAPLKPLGKGHLARPLLGIRRNEIAQFAADHQLTWVEDPTNQEPRFRRNFLRHHIMPALQTVYPGLTATLARAADHCAQTQTLLNEYIEADLKHCLGKTSDILDIVLLKKLSPLKQKQILRHWLSLNQIPYPCTQKLHDLWQQILWAKEDAQPCITWEGAYLRRYQNKLYSLKAPVDFPSHYQWDLNTALQLPDGSQWEAKLIPGNGIAVHKLLNRPLDVCFRRGGERCRPAGRPHSQALKKILQERGIPAWQRSTLPLLYHQQTLVGVGDLFVCEGWQTENTKELGWVIEKL